MTPLRLSDDAGPRARARRAAPGPGNLHGGFAQVGYGNTAQLGLLNAAVANGPGNNILSAFSGNIFG